MKHDIFLTEENSATVILNEQHSLLPDQIKLLDNKFDTWNIFHVPAKGWNLEELIQVREKAAGIVVFASPIPILIHWFTEDSCLQPPEVWPIKRPRSQVVAVYIFHNDKRDKKESPSGKIIYTIAKTGWQLI